MTHLVTLNGIPLSVTRFLYGGNARPQPSPPPDPIDMPFEMPLTDEFSEYELVKDRDGAGVEAHAQLIERDHLRRED